jgi:hypothetical protein
VLSTNRKEKMGIMGLNNPQTFLRGIPEKYPIKQRIMKTVANRKGSSNASEIKNATKAKKTFVLGSSL